MVNIKFDVTGIMKSFKTRVSGWVITVVGDEDYVQNFSCEVPWHMPTWACWDGR